MLSSPALARLTAIPPQQRSAASSASSNARCAASDVPRSTIWFTATSLSASGSGVVAYQAVTAPSWAGAAIVDRQWSACAALMLVGSSQEPDNGPGTSAVSSVYRAWVEAAECGVGAWLAAPIGAVPGAGWSAANSCASAS